MTTSASATCGVRTSWISTASGTPPSGAGGGSIDLAPRDRICSRASSRMSNPSTKAPRRRAVAIAWSPATPAPSTRTRAGGTVPAAVMRRGSILGSRPAARRTDWNPSTVACDDSTSTAWARVLRGTRSSASIVALVAATSTATSGRQTGSNSPTTTWSAPRWPSASRSVGPLTDTTTPPSPMAAAGSGAMEAPAARYASSGMPAAAPAPVSTTTECPSTTSAPVASGVTATRRSPALRSHSTAILMGTPDRTNGPRPLVDQRRIVVPARNRITD